MSPFPCGNWPGVFLGFCTKVELIKHFFKTKVKKILKGVEMPGKALA